MEWRASTVLLHMEHTNTDEQKTDLLWAMGARIPIHKKLNQHHPT